MWPKGWGIVGLVKMEGGREGICGVGEEKGLERGREIVGTFKIELKGFGGAVGR